jgi:hypothetical protein
MKRAGQWIMLIPASIVLILMSCEGFFAYSTHESFGVYRAFLALGPAFLTLIVLLIPGAALWLAGWIVEGFAKDTP